MKTTTCDLIRWSGSVKISETSEEWQTFQYGDNSMSRREVYEWMGRFKGRTNVMMRVMGGHRLLG